MYNDGYLKSDPYHFRARQVNGAYKENLLMSEGGNFESDAYHFETRPASLCGEHIPLGTKRWCDVKSRSMMLIQRHNNILCQVGWATRKSHSRLIGDHL